MLRERGGMDRQTDRDYSIPNVVHHKRVLQGDNFAERQKGREGH